MLPYLDHQTFQVDPSALLSLIQNRVQHHPSDWAHLDHNLNKFAADGDLFEKKSNATWFSILESSYGQQLPTYSAPSFVEARALTFLDAELLFERQSQLYAFLVRLVNMLVKPKPKVGRDEWDAAARSCFIQAKSMSTFSRLEPGIGHMAERGICSPLEFDFQVLDDVVRMRQNGAEQELRQLQNDPRFLKGRLDQLIAVKSYQGKDMWTKAALDVWGPTFRRARSMNLIALGTRNLCRELQTSRNGTYDERVRDAKAWLYNLVRRLVPGEYRQMIVNAISKGTLKDAVTGHVPQRDRRRKATNAQIAIGFHKDMLAKDPLLWSMTQLSLFMFTGNNSLPLSEIVQVAADAIVNRDGADLVKLHEAYVIDMIADLAMMGSIIGALEMQDITQRELLWPDERSFVDASAKLIGQFYRHKWTSEWADVFDQPKQPLRPFPPSELAELGKLLQVFSKSKFNRARKEIRPKELDEELITRQNLKQFWDTWHQKRIQYVQSQNNGLSMDQVHDMPEIKIMNAFKQDSLDSLRKKIDSLKEQREARVREKAEHDQRASKRPQSPSFLNKTRGLTLSPKKIKTELSKVQIRAVAREQSATERDAEAQAAAAAGAEEPEFVPDRIPGEKSRHLCAVLAL